VLPWKSNRPGSDWSPLDPFSKWPIVARTLCDLMEGDVATMTQSNGNYWLHLINAEHHEPAWRTPKLFDRLKMSKK
jgi:hypothetical protein